MKNTTPTSETSKCNRCNTTQAVGEFRVHKSGYVLGQCKTCERKASKLRRKKTTGSFSLETPGGKSFKVSNTPVTGSRKVTHEGTTKVVYVVGATRDEARSLFAKYANVTRNSVKATVV
jgi:hypothetical protein